MKILLIEDDPGLGKFLSNSLKEEGFEVDLEADGEKGLFAALTNECDIIILDYALPKMDGRTVCKKVREENLTVPILMLSVQASAEMKIELLNLGADDYLAKPFSFEELVARIRALLRRPREIQKEIYHLGNVTVDTKNQLVERAGQEIYLTPKEFNLLEYLLRNKGKVVTRGMILEHVWDMNADMFSNAIEAHISNLRKKITDENSAEAIIRTLPGRGYKIP